MPFSSFTLESAREQFGLNLSTSDPLFARVPPVDAGQSVRENLETFGELALSVNTEKARSEWLNRSDSGGDVATGKKDDLPDVRSGLYRR
jgi:hypothetical protein